MRSSVTPLRAPVESTEQLMFFKQEMKLFFPALLISRAHSDARFLEVLFVCATLFFILFYLPLQECSYLKAR
jgi:hypothetical protein